MILKPWMFSSLLAFPLLAYSEGAPDLTTPEGVTAAGLKWAGKKLEKDYDLGPFKLALGATDGGAGASLTGSGRKQLARWIDERSLFAGQHLSTGISLGYEADAGWKSDADAANNASFSLQPSFDLLWSEGQLPLPAGQTPKELATALFNEAKPKIPACMARFKNGPIDIAECKLLPMPKPRTYWNLSGDLRYRYGSIEESGSIVRVNQAIFGALSSWVVFTPETLEWVRQWPTLSAGYYTVVDTKSSMASVPDELKADHLKVGLSTKISLGPLRQIEEGRRDYLAALYLDLDATKATSGPDKDWQALYKAQLVFQMKGAWKPAITFRDGSEFGLDFDEEVIVGFLLPLLQ